MKCPELIEGILSRNARFHGVNGVETGDEPIGISTHVAGLQHIDFGRCLHAHIYRILTHALYAAPWAPHRYTPIRVPDHNMLCLVGFGGQTVKQLETKTVNHWPLSIPLRGSLLHHQPINMPSFSGFLVGWLAVWWTPALAGLLPITFPSDLMLSRRFQALFLFDKRFGASRRADWLCVSLYVSPP